jgi:hypothetical protein
MRKINLRKRYRIVIIQGGTLYDSPNLQPGYDLQKIYEKGLKT